MKIWSPLGLATLLALSGVASAKDIVETAKSAGQFSILLKAAMAAGLDRTLAEPGPYTVFAPTDAAKFMSYEATGIAPFTTNSPLVSWWHSLLGLQGASYMLGVLEITTGILLALYWAAPRAAVLGGAMAVVTFLITLSFFLTTPGVPAPMGFPAISANVGQFLLKAAGLPGVSIWLLGEAVVATTRYTPISKNRPPRSDGRTV